MPATRIRIITRGDDVGSFRSANRGVLDAYRNGILRNASLMAVCPYVEEAARMLAGTDLCFGLHMTMNCEWDTVKWGPLLGAEKAPSLVDAHGHLHGDPSIHLRSGVVFAEMLAECRAQLARLRSLGFAVRYVEPHMGFDWLFEKGDESVRFSDVVRTWAAAEGLVYDLVPLASLPKVAHPSGDLVADFADALDTAGPGTYLVVMHPCFDDEEIRGQRVSGQVMGVEAAARDAQRRVYTDTRVLDIVKRRGIELTTYADAAA